MKLIITALEIIEKEAHKLREEIKKGRKLGLKDLKLILGAFGLIAGDKQFQNEAFKINMLFGAGLVAFAEFTKRWGK